MGGQSIWPPVVHTPQIPVDVRNHGAFRAALGESGVPFIRTNVANMSQM